MGQAAIGAGASGYTLCQYGTSKLQFRGPAPDISRPYLAVLGGTETFGKFMARPYPALLQATTGLGTANLGCMNAGPDVFLNDSGVMQVAAGARACVVQIMGAQNLSNRHYSVHPRRNDRFLCATPRLTVLFPEVDFTDFHFTRHMLRTLQTISADRFAVVAEDLRRVWVARMTALLRGLRGNAVLLWFADRPTLATGLANDLARDPVLVDEAMMEQITTLAAGRVDVVFDPQFRQADLAGMGFATMEMAIAATMPGPAAHQLAAERLTRVLGGIL